MFDVICPICGDALPFSEFRFISCGHGLCIRCTDRTTTSSVCAICRRDKDKSHKPHRIFLDFAQSNSESESVRQIARNLDAINADSAAIDLQSSSRKIHELACDPDSIAGQSLLHALQNLDERIAPVISELTQVKQENARLLGEVTELHQKLNAQNALEVESVRASRRLCEQEQSLQSMIRNLKQLEIQLDEEKDINTKLKYRVQRRDDEIKRKCEQIRQQQKDLSDRDKKIHVQKIKLKQLVRATGKAKSTNEEDESLLVEPPLVNLDLVKNNLAIQYKPGNAKLPHDRYRRLNN